MAPVRRRRTIRKRLMTWLAILLGLYVLWCGTLFFLQNRLIFPAKFAGESGPVFSPSVEPVPRHIDGGSVTAWFYPAADASPDHAAGLVVFCHGNAELVSDQAALAQYYHGLGLSVLLIGYRGYGDNAGSPSQRAIVDDARWFLDQTLARPEVDADRLVIHGRSIGGGVAAQLARARPPRLLILQSTMYSIPAMARGYLVPSFLIASPFRTDRVVRAADYPVLLMHGTRDTIIPSSHSERLARLSSHARLIEFPAGHNDFPGPGEMNRYHNAIEHALHEAGALEGE